MEETHALLGVIEKSERNNEGCDQLEILLRIVKDGADEGFNGSSHQPRRDYTMLPRVPNDKVTDSILAAYLIQLAVVGQALHRIFCIT